MTSDERLDDQLRVLWKASLDAPAPARRRKARPSWPRVPVVIAAITICAGAIAYAQSATTEKVVATGGDNGAETTDGLPPAFESVVPILDGSLPVTMVDGTELLVELETDGKYAEAKVSTTLAVEQPRSLATPLFAESPDALASAHCTRQRESSDLNEECSSQAYPVPESNLHIWTSTSDAVRANAIGFRQNGRDIAWLMPPAEPDELSRLVEGTRASLAHEAWLVLEGEVDWLEETAVEYHVTLVDASGSTGPAFTVSIGCGAPTKSDSSGSVGQSNGMEAGDYVCVPSIVGVDTPGSDFLVSGPGRDLVDVIVIPEPSP